MVKVLQILPYPLHHPGGVEIFVKNLVNNLIKNENIEVDILTTDLEDPNPHEEVLDSNIHVFYLKNYGTLWGMNPLFKITDFLKEKAKVYDILHAHSYIFFSSIQTIYMGKRLGIPTVLTLHGGIQTGAMQFNTLKEKLQLFIKNTFFDLIFGKYIIKNATKIVSVSKQDLDYLPKAFRVKRDDGIWIPNAVDTDIFKPKNGNAGKYITFIGRLSLIKGFDIFLEIMEKVNSIIQDVPILIIGKGELSPMIQRHNNLNITYIPEVSYEEMPNYYYKTKIFVLPSRTEGLPTTILEAMASKVPVITTNVGGIPDVIEDNSTGFLFSPSDIESMASKIIEIMSDKNDKIKFIVESAYDRIQRLFSWKAIARRYLQLYSELMK